MFGFLLGLFARPVVKTALVLGVLVQAYWLVAPRSSEERGFLRRAWAQEVAHRLASELPDRVGAATVGVLPLVNDPDGFIAGPIRDAISAKKRYRVTQDSLIQRWLREVRGGDLPPQGLAEALVAARRTGADLVVFGEFSYAEAGLGPPSTGTRLRLDVRVAERESAQAVFAARYERGGTAPRTSLEHWRGALADSSKPGRVVLWGLAMFLLPLLTVRLISYVTAEESNLMNFLLVAAYGVAGTALAFGLTGFWIPSVWTLAVLTVAGLVAAYYGYRVASVVDDLRR